MKNKETRVLKMFLYECFHLLEFWLLLGKESEEGTTHWPRRVQESINENQEAHTIEGGHLGMAKIGNKKLSSMWQETFTYTSELVSEYVRTGQV